MLSVTAPATPNILPALSLSSSIASLDPLERSTPVSPALAPIPEQVGGGGGGVGGEALREEWEEVEVGKGQANFNSSEMERVKGMKRSVTGSPRKSFWDVSVGVRCRSSWLTKLFLFSRLSFLRCGNSSKIAEVLGYSDSEYVVESITLRVLSAVAAS